MNKDSGFFTHEIPDDPSLLTALGRLAIRHAQLNTQLMYLLAVLCGAEFVEVYKKHVHASTISLANEVVATAEGRNLGDQMTQVKSLTNRAKRAARTTRQYDQAFWYRQSGDFLARMPNGMVFLTPTRADVDATARQMTGVANEIHDLRLQGKLGHPPGNSDTS